LLQNKAEENSKDLYNSCYPNLGNDFNSTLKEHIDKGQT
jgi:hypothetical protein